jgi:hypothetical protein
MQITWPRTIAASERVCQEKGVVPLSFWNQRNSSRLRLTTEYMPALIVDVFAGFAKTPSWEELGIFW